MRLWPVVRLLICCSFIWASLVGVIAAQQQTASTAEIQQLVEQLGHNEYVKRQQAETQLIERGAEAFAALQAAELHADLEVATRAKYIVNQVRIEWVRPTDSSEIRKIMSRYGELSTQQQLKKIAELSVLENQRGFGALCRIARFDSSARNKRFAVLAILEQGILPEEQVASAVAMLEQESAGVDRGLMAWIRVYVDQIQSPEVIDPRWLGMIEEELEPLDRKVVNEEHLLAISLIRYHLKMCDQVSDAQQAFECWQMCIERELGFHASSRNDPFVVSLRSIELVAQETLQLGYPLLWGLNNEQWQLLPLVEESYRGEIESERLYRYLVAEGKNRQGLAAEAEVLASETLHAELIEEDIDEEKRKQLLEQEARKRKVIADLLGELGRHDWAEREWANVIDSLPATDPTSLTARQSLGVFCLHDRKENEAAANLLAETIDAIDGDQAVRSRYQGNSRLRNLLKSFRSNHAYFLACHYESGREHEKQQQYLASAYRYDSDNADVLIAMYRLPDASDTYRKSTRSKIAAAKRMLESKIKQEPGNPHWYNHWAWLVSNTEGNFSKAVEYSERSLKLEPGSASYLDTLGRCCYAAGELEKAVEVQRRAVAKHPHLQVMRRQLELFEGELEKRAASEN